jgi:hypothetical protein
LILEIPSAKRSTPPGQVNKSNPFAHRKAKTIEKRQEPKCTHRRTLQRERTVKEFDVLLVGKKKASPLKSIRDPLRRKIKLLLERTAGLAEAAAAVAAITVASACRPPTITSQPPKREAFS